MTLSHNKIGFLWGLFIFLLPFSLHAAAWTLGNGEAQIHETIRWYKSGEFLDQSGRTTPQPDYSKLELDSYAEYGWTDDTTLGTQFALYRATNDLSDEYNIGVGDPTLFVRHRLWQNDSSVFSVQPLIKFPSFSRDDQLARSGTDAMNLELRLLAGHSFEAFQQYHFINAEIAYRKRMEGFGDQILADLTFGYRLNERWSIMPQLFTTWRLSSNTASSTIQIFDNDYDAVKGKLSGVYQLNDKLSLQLGVFYDIWGQNTGRGQGITFTTGYTF